MEQSKEEIEARKKEKMEKALLLWAGESTAGSGKKDSKEKATKGRGSGIDGKPMSSRSTSSDKGLQLVGVNVKGKGESEVAEESKDKKKERMEAQIAMWAGKGSASGSPAKISKSVDGGEVEMSPQAKEAVEICARGMEKVRNRESGLLAATEELNEGASAFAKSRDGVLSAMKQLHATNVDIAVSEEEMKKLQVMEVIEGVDNVDALQGLLYRLMLDHPMIIQDVEKHMDNIEDLASVAKKSKSHRRKREKKLSKAKGCPSSPRPVKGRGDASPRRKNPSPLPKKTKEGDN